MPRVHNFPTQTNDENHNAELLNVPHSLRCTSSTALKHLNQNKNKNILRVLAPSTVTQPQHIGSGTASKGLSNSQKNTVGNATSRRRARRLVKPLKRSQSAHLSTRSNTSSSTSLALKKSTFNPSLTTAEVAMTPNTQRTHHVNNILLQNPTKDDVVGQEEGSGSGSDRDIGAGITNLTLFEEKYASEEVFMVSKGMSKNRDNSSNPKKSRRTGKNKRKTKTKVTSSSSLSLPLPCLPVAGLTVPVPLSLRSSVSTTTTIPPAADINPTGMTGASHKNTNDNQEEESSNGVNSSDSIHEVCNQESPQSIPSSSSLDLTPYPAYSSYPNYPLTPRYHTHATPAVVNLPRTPIPLFATTTVTIANRERRRFSEPLLPSYSPSNRSHANNAINTNASSFREGAHRGHHYKHYYNYDDGVIPMTAYSQSTQDILLKSAALLTSPEPLKSSLKPPSTQPSTHTSEPSLPASTSHVSAVSNTLTLKPEGDLINNTKTKSAGKGSENRKDTGSSALMEAAWNSIRALDEAFAAPIPSIPPIPPLPLTSEYSTTPVTSSSSTPLSLTANPSKHTTLPESNNPHNSNNPSTASSATDLNNLELSCDFPPPHTPRFRSRRSHSLPPRSSSRQVRDMRFNGMNESPQTEREKEREGEQERDDAPEHNSNNPNNPDLRCQVVSARATPRRGSRPNNPNKPTNNPTAVTEGSEKHLNQNKNEEIPRERRFKHQLKYELFESPLVSDVSLLAGNHKTENENKNENNRQFKKIKMAANENDTKHFYIPQTNNPNNPKPDNSDMAEMSYISAHSICARPAKRRFSDPSPNYSSHNLQAAEFSTDTHLTLNPNNPNNPSSATRVGVTGGGTTLITLSSTDITDHDKEREREAEKRGKRVKISSAKMKNHHLPPKHQKQQKQGKTTQREKRQRRDRNRDRTAQPLPQHADEVNIDLSLNNSENGNRKDQDDDNDAGVALTVLNQAAALSTFDHSFHDASLHGSTGVEGEERLERYDDELYPGGAVALTAVVKLQALYRGRVARRYVRGLKHLITREVQDRVDQTLQKEREKEREKRVLLVLQLEREQACQREQAARTEACRTLQSWLRGRLAVRKLNRLKTSARLQREKQEAEVRAAELKQTQLKATVVIQSAARGRLARLRVKQIRSSRQILRIQAISCAQENLENIFQKCFSKLKAKQQRARELRQIVLIQAYQRGKRDRRKVAILQAVRAREVKAAETRVLQEQTEKAREHQLQLEQRLQAERERLGGEVREERKRLAELQGLLASEREARELERRDLIGELRSERRDRKQTQQQLEQKSEMIQNFIQKEQEQEQEQKQEKVIERYDMVINSGADDTCPVTESESESAIEKPPAVIAVDAVGSENAKNEAVDRNHPDSPAISSMLEFRELDSLESSDRVSVASTALTALTAPAVPVAPVKSHAHTDPPPPDHTITMAMTPMVSAPSPSPSQQTPAIPPSLTSSFLSTGSENKDQVVSDGPNNPNKPSSSLSENSSDSNQMKIQNQNKTSLDRLNALFLQVENQLLIHSSDADPSLSLPLSTTGDKKNNNNTQNPIPHRLLGDQKNVGESIRVQRLNNPGNSGKPGHPRSGDGQLNGCCAPGRHCNSNDKPPLTPHRNTGRNAQNGVNVSVRNARGTPVIPIPPQSLSQAARGRRKPSPELAHETTDTPIPAIAAPRSVSSEASTTNLSNLNVLNLTGPTRGSRGIRGRSESPMRAAIAMVRSTGHQRDRNLSPFRMPLPLPLNKAIDSKESKESKDSKDRTETPSVTEPEPEKEKERENDRENKNDKTEIIPRSRNLGQPTLAGSELEVSQSLEVSRVRARTGQGRNCAAPTHQSLFDTFIL